MSNYSEIKEELKQRQQKSRDLRAQSFQVTGMDRWKIQQEKRDLGVATRHILLGYAFLRGAPYLTCERTTRLPVYYRALIWDCEKVGMTLDGDAIQGWLKAPLIQEEAA